jgi:hypothetical protein
MPMDSFFVVETSSLAGLPDGLFSDQKYQFGKFWRVLRWKMLVYFMTIWHILRLFVTFKGNLVDFTRFL